MEQHYLENKPLVAFEGVVLHNVGDEEAALHRVHMEGQSCQAAPRPQEQDVEEHQVTRISVDHVAVAEKMGRERDTDMVPLPVQVADPRVAQMELAGGSLVRLEAYCTDVEAYCTDVEVELLPEVVPSLVGPSHARHEAVQAASIEATSVLAVDGLALRCPASA